MTLESLQVFYQAARDPWGPARAWRAKTGGPVVACVSGEVPEDLLLAAGALPLIIWGSQQKVTLADGHLPAWVCSFSRTSLDTALRGELDFCDGFLIPQTCDTLRTLYGVWQECFPGRWVETYLLPRQVARPSAAAYLVHELARLRDALCRWTGRVMDEDHLRAAIDVANRCRRLLGEVYAAHRRRPRLLTNADLFTVLSTAFLLPREELATHLEALLTELGGVPEQEPARSGCRLVLSGSVAGPPEVFARLDAAGLVVVADDLHNGSRLLVETPAAGEPLAALAWRQLHLPPTGFLNRGDLDRRRHLLDLVRREGAAGVLFLHLRFCEPENYDYRDLYQALERAGVQHQRLEVELVGAAGGQLATRLEAFTEVLGGTDDAF